MAHHLHAVFGPKIPVGQFGGRWLSAHFVGLPQDFALIPLTESLHDEIMAAGHSQGADPFPQFERLSASVEAALREASAFGPLAYIETEYFGGCGTQAAVAWNGGGLLTGPFKTEMTWSGSDKAVTPRGEWAINRVLLALGVAPASKSDAFDTVGLGQFRSTESVEERSA